MVQLQVTWHSYNLVHESATINQFARAICTAQSQVNGLAQFSLGSVAGYTTPEVKTRLFYNGVSLGERVIIKEYYPSSKSTLFVIGIPIMVVWGGGWGFIVQSARKDNLSNAKKSPCGLNILDIAIKPTPLC